MKSIAHEFDEKAKGLANDYLNTEGLLLTVLIEMRRLKLFAVLNYSGIFDYGERRLRLSRAQAYYFKTVAEKSEEVPQIKEAVVQGELTLSEARRIVPVITKENHAEWIGKAKALGQRELEREVTAVNPKAHPPKEKLRPVAKDLSELKVPVDAKTEENLAALKEILSQKLGKAATLTEVIAWAAEVTRTKFDPVKRAGRSRKISSRKSQVMPTPGRKPVRASVKHPVVLRDDMRCTHVSEDGRRCEQKRWLQLHHQIEVRHGGRNTVENLRLLCFAHHALIHSEAGPRTS
jgi:HNH endonuclease